MVTRSSSTSNDELIEDFDGENLQVLLCPTIVAPPTAGPAKVLAGATAGVRVLHANAL